MFSMFSHQANPHRPQLVAPGASIRSGAGPRLDKEEKGSQEIERLESKTRKKARTGEQKEKEELTARMKKGGGWRRWKRGRGRIPVQCSAALPLQTEHEPQLFFFPLFKNFLFSVVPHTLAQLSVAWWLRSQ
jgi:hypothetical protein